jgi:molybdopterin converting factor subunit 1
MRAKIRLFALLRERAGSGQLALQLPEGATVGDLLRELQGQHPGLLLDIPSTMIAVNMEYVSEDHLLQDGDEVALIPPVSGGAP